MTSLTRATLGKLAERETKVAAFGESQVRLQKPTPFEYGKYQTGLLGKDGKPAIENYADAIMGMVARMWIDDDGKRLYSDAEVKELGTIDLQFYQWLSSECQLFANGSKADETLGESDTTTD